MAGSMSVDTDYELLRRAIQGSVATRDPFAIVGIEKYLKRKAIGSIAEFVKRQTSLVQEAGCEPLGFALNDLKRLGELCPVIEALNRLRVIDSLKDFALDKAKQLSARGKSVQEKLCWIAENAERAGIDASSLQAKEGGVHLRLEEGRSQRRPACDDSGLFTMMAASPAVSRQFPAAGSEGAGQVAVGIASQPSQESSGDGPPPLDGSGRIPGGDGNNNGRGRADGASGGGSGDVTGASRRRRDSVVDVNLRLHISVSAPDNLLNVTMTSEESEAMRLETTHL